MTQLDKNCIHVDTITKTDNKIQVKFTVNGEWTKFFCDDVFYVEYSEPIYMIPDSVAIIPFIGDVVILASMIGACVEIEEIDEDFYYSIPEFIKGFSDVYPEVSFNADIVHANRIVKNTLTNENNKSLLFFSGGVDVYSSLISHVNEKPMLFFVWGADIDIDNYENWRVAKTSVCKSAENFGLEIACVKSNFRKVLNNSILDREIELAKGDWWYYFHHSIAMMTLSVPIAYIKGATKCYFASTHEKNVAQKVRLASLPCIDNKVKFSSCQVVHDGEQYDRYEKTKRICNYSKENSIPIKLRVCYQKSGGGNNCCKCEKCIRSVIPIILEGYNPTEFGFDIDMEQLPADICSAIKYLCDTKSKYVVWDDYGHSHRVFKQRYTPDLIPSELKLIYESNFDELYDFLSTKNLFKEWYYEIKNWCIELEEGKNWLEQEWKRLGKELNELHEWCDGLEKGKKWLEVENRKQKEEIDKLHSHRTL